jgi:hypothetical protein
MNLRELVEHDLSDTLEGDWGLPVELVDPNGVLYTKSANDPTLDLVGQILYDTTVQNPDTGAEIVVHKPVVTLRRSSLIRVPLSGELWWVRIPLTPSYSATKVGFLLEQATEDGGSIGFIRLYLQAAEQSP